MSRIAPRRRNNFHAVRLLAAIAVLFGHGYAVMGHACEPLVECRLGYTNISRLAVDTFFVISGFLITQSWVSDPDPFRFLVRRVARIMPGLFVSVLVVAFVIGPLETTLPLSSYFRSHLMHQFLSWCILWPGPFILPGVFQSHPLPIVIATLWTLPIEFVCYLAVLAAGIVGVVKRPLALVCFTLACVACAMLPTNQITFRYAECAVYFSAGNVMFLFRDKIRFSLLIGLLICAAAILTQGLLQKALLLGGLPYIVMSVALSETPYVSDLERSAISPTRSICTRFRCNRCWRRTRHRRRQIFCFRSAASR